MKIRKSKSRVTIEIYDADGEMRESIGGQYTFREIRDMMRDIVQNDGIPVIRQLGKHEAKDETMIGKAMEEMLPDLKAACEKTLKGFKPDGEIRLLNLPKVDPIPMVLEYKFDGIEFRAAGHPLDVHAANEALLKRVFEEGKENG